MTTHPKSFSELLYDQNFTDLDRKNIYVMLGDAFEEPLFKPSKLIMQLFRTKKFPFVITTSFTPVVEDAMREVWGDDLRVMTFSNDPSHNDDIVTRSDISKPTVYYMFGKVCRSDKKYVVTDYDMLNFCRAWLNSAERPQNLTSELQPISSDITGICVAVFKLFQEVHIAIGSVTLQTMQDIGDGEIIVAVPFHIRRLQVDIVILIHIDMVYGVVVSFFIAEKGSSLRISFATDFIKVFFCVLTFILGGLIVMPSFLSIGYLTSARIMALSF